MDTGLSVEKMILGGIGAYILYQVMKGPETVYITKPMDSVRMSARHNSMNRKAFKRGGLAVPDSGHNDELLYRESVPNVGIDGIYDIYTKRIHGNIDLLNQQHFNTNSKRRVLIRGPGNVRQPVTQFITNWYAEVFPQTGGSFVARPPNAIM